MVVIDEQHRFGVMQRATLRGKGINADVLVMTATPIPRTLAMTVYGDLDVSVIDEMPPGKKPVHTVLVVGKQKRQGLSDNQRGTGKRPSGLYCLSIGGRVGNSGFKRRHKYV